MIFVELVKFSKAPLILNKAKIEMTTINNHN